MKKPVLVRFDPQDVERIDKIADELDTSRENLIKKYVRYGIEDFKIASTLGLPTLLPLFKKMKIDVKIQ